MEQNCNLLVWILFTYNHHIIGYNTMKFNQKLCKPQSYLIFDRKNVVVWSACICENGALEIEFRTPANLYCARFHRKNVQKIPVNWAMCKSMASWPFDLSLVTIFWSLWSLMRSSIIVGVLNVALKHRSCQSATWAMAWRCR